MPPVVVLFVLAVLILAQVFYVVFPRRTTYLRRLLLALVGVALAEFIGSHAPVTGPRLGDLHPPWDLGVTAVIQLVANRFGR